MCVSVFRHEIWIRPSMDVLFQVPKSIVCSEIPENCYFPAKISLKNDSINTNLLVLDLIVGYN